MKRITSKLTRVLLVTLLYAMTVTTAIAQESPKVDLNALAAKEKLSRTRTRTRWF